MLDMYAMKLLHIVVGEELLFHYLEDFGPCKVRVLRHGFPPYRVNVDRAMAWPPSSVVRVTLRTVQLASDWGVQMRARARTPEMFGLELSVLSAPVAAST